MSLSAEAVTRILETRYDWYSARNVLKAAAERAGVAASGPFDAKALQGLADALSQVDTHVEKAVSALRQAAESAGSQDKPAAAAPKAPTPAPAAEAAPAAPAAAESAPAEAGEGDGEGKKPAAKKK